MTTKWLAARDARVVISGSLLLSAAGVVLLWSAEAGSGYLLGVALPGVLVMFGAGIAFPPIIGAATAGVAPDLNGLLSGVVNTTRMVGGALGLAILATVANSTTNSASGSRAQALTEGFQTAFLVGAGFAILGLIFTLLLISNADSRAHVALGSGEPSGATAP